MPSLHDLTALEQAAAIRRREISPTDLTDHYLGRIGAHNDKVGAFITVTADRARAQAAEAERRVMGASGTDVLPPLLGVPVPIKDLNRVDGVRCTFGSTVYADWIADSDDHVVSLLRAAGTVMLGKTNTPEFGCPCYTENRVAPPARTPWDLSRSAGGSSGGAGAAVAAGLAPAAHGSDGGGSVRIPASACGLVGLKVSRGRISNGPLGGDVSGLSWSGPIARTVRDAAALLDAMAIPMPGDPHWAPPLPPGDSFSAAAERDPGRLRIGRFITPAAVETEVHPDCEAAYEDASRLLAGLGHEVEDVEPPFTAGAVPFFERVWAVMAGLAPVPPGAEEQLMPLTRWLREQAESVSGHAYAEAIAVMQAASRIAIAGLATYDALLTPTLALPPAPVGSIRDDADPARDFHNQKAFTPFTAVYNVTGQPAINLPLSWNQDGLPIGVMLAGRPAGEAQLISLAAQMEAACPTWTVAGPQARRPALW